MAPAPFDVEPGKRLDAPALLRAILWAAVLLVAGAARGAAFTVDTTIDGPDAAAGDGVCATANGQCTLRAAVGEANALPGTDVIALDAATYGLTDGDPGGRELVLSDSAMLMGQGSGSTAIEGALRLRAVSVVYGVSVNGGIVDEYPLPSTTLDAGAATLPRASARLRRSAGSLVLSGVGGTTFTVDSTDDEHDAVPGDGVCATAAGACTLRAAFEAPGEEETAVAINVPAGVYRLTLGSLRATRPPRDWAVVGAGAAVTVIDAAGASPALDSDAFSLTLTGLTVRGAGDGIFSGCCEVILEDCVVTDNLGMGVSVRALTVVDSTVSNNGSGGIDGYTPGSTVVVGSRIVGNRSEGSGAGIVTSGDNGSSPLAVEDSTIDGNIATENGGGISGFLKSSIRIVHSTISNNTAGNEGGGVYGGRPSTLTIVDSTFSGNEARIGGGLAVLANQSFVLRSSTITGNRAREGGGGISFSLFGMFPQPDTIDAGNTILAGNTDASGEGPDCFVIDAPGSLTSRGYNLIGDPTGCVIIGDTTGNLSGDPGLGPLQDNGGPTLTHALASGSPAIDGGNPGGCTDADGSVLITDQRGAPRHQPARCDIGAYEAGPASSPTPTPPATTLATATATVVDAGTPTVTPTGLPTAAGTPPAGLDCPGDCNGDASVAINELTLGVNIALGMRPVSDCLALDRSPNGIIEINELILAVNSALGDCTA